MYKILAQAAETDSLNWPEAIVLVAIIAAGVFSTYLFLRD